MCVRLAAFLFNLLPFYKRFFLIKFNSPSAGAAANLLAPLAFGLLGKGWTYDNSKFKLINHPLNIKTLIFTCLNYLLIGYKILNFVYAFDFTSIDISKSICFKENLKQNLTESQIEKIKEYNKALIWATKVMMLAKNVKSTLPDDVDINNLPQSAPSTVPSPFF